jgi:trans-AT polyketide synthase/acyltransferase/oxidoreductase domain-containing protein
MQPATTPPRTLGLWNADTTPPTFDAAGWRDALAALESPLYLLWDGEQHGVGMGGQANLGAAITNGANGAFDVTGFVAPCPPDALGDPAFRAAHGVRYAYVTGAMANGIASVELVETIARAGMLAFFGAAGLPVAAVEESIHRLQSSIGELPHGFNLIHSPNEPHLEAAVVDLYLREGVRLVEASAYLDLTLPVVRYRVSGIHRAADGTIIAPNKVMAKVSRIEVASKFFAPPPERFLKELVAAGDITAEQAEWASHIPMAEDLTAEADSGGHTDNRPALTLLPTLIAQRDRAQAEYGYATPLRVGAAGGIGTPESAAAAFAMGAAYIVTGTVNQACIESGSSDLVRTMLAETGQADVTMAPAADMFEMGVTVQVLKRGTMFAMRAQKLYEIYRAHAGIEAMPEAERIKLEKSVFRLPMDEVWEQTKRYFETVDPRQIQRGEQDPKHRMALIFRWYLGQSSTWANRGIEDRKVDYQIWCGPVMGAFNEWVRGSFLEDWKNREATVVALNILFGAAYLTRANAARQQGVPLEPAVVRVDPQPLATLAGCGAA